MSTDKDFANTLASLRVVRGNPDEAELAALVAGVLTTAQVGEEEPPGSPRSAWMNRQRTLRGRPVGVLGRGAHAWRHSLR